VKKKNTLSTNHTPTHVFPPFTSTTMYMNLLWVLIGSLDCLCVLCFGSGLWVKVWPVSSRPWNLVSHLPQIRGYTHLCTNYLQPEFFYSLTIFFPLQAKMCDVKVCHQPSDNEEINLIIVVFEGRLAACWNH